MASTGSYSDQHPSTEHDANNPGSSEGQPAKDSSRPFAGYSGRSHNAASDPSKQRLTGTTRKPVPSQPQNTSASYQASSREANGVITGESNVEDNMSSQQAMNSSSVSEGQSHPNHSEAIETPQATSSQGVYVRTSEATGSNANGQEVSSGSGQTSQRNVGPGVRMDKQKSPEDTDTMPPLPSRPANTILELSNSNTGTSSSLPRTTLKGYGWLSNDHSQRKKWPTNYRKPGVSYKDDTPYHHRDALGREINGPIDDRYISPVDGHLAKLVVQAVDNVYDGPTNSTWRRTFIRNRAPWPMRLALYPLNKKIRKGYEVQDYSLFCLRWVISCFGLLCTIGLPISHNGIIRNAGWYDPLPYKYWGYAQRARNASENRPLPQDARSGFSAPQRAPAGVSNLVSAYQASTVSAIGNQSTENSVTKRILTPKYLNFVEEREDGGHDCVRLNVDVWRQTHTVALSYIIVAYSAQQFRHNTDDNPPKQHDDVTVLRQIGLWAALHKEVDAFWLAADCIDDEDIENEVYRISDILRGAAATIIVLGQPFSHPGSKTDYTEAELLQQWGKRVWTFPEVLLSKAGQGIDVWTRQTWIPDLEMEPRTIPKNQFAVEVWGDAETSRQLIDNYEGNLRLSELELVTLALRCLSSRETDPKYPGDLSYALMGLLRLRPKVDPTDSAFQAFARLSLANDSNMLLERLICILPKNPNQPWESMEDAWDVNLWDIYPTTQVSGVCQNDSVIFDGAFGATIRWKSFEPVATFGKDSWRRAISQVAFHGAPYTMYTGFVLIIVGSVYVYAAVIAVGIIIFIYAFIVLAFSPILVRALYGGKVYNTQAWFFGFEGYADLETIEERIWGRRERYFGADEKRLSWSTSSSPLSRHVTDGSECVGVDPVRHSKEVRDIVEKARTSQMGEPKVFTLVDTYTRTITLFEAVHPPVGILVTGSEGGMQRAVGVSYDWTTGTLIRETIFRMETTILERMFRVPRCRFAFSREERGRWQTR